MRSVKLGVTRFAVQNLFVNHKRNLNTADGVIKSFISIPNARYAHLV